MFRIWYSHISQKTSYVPADKISPSSSVPERTIISSPRVAFKIGPGGSPLFSTDDINFVCVSLIEWLHSDECYHYVPALPHSLRNIRPGSIMAISYHFIDWFKPSNPFNLPSRHPYPFAVHLSHSDSVENWVQTSTAIGSIQELLPRRDGKYRRCDHILQVEERKAG